MSQKPWWVYILLCSDGTLYTGSTNDLQKRFATHNNGVGARYTRSRLPATIVFQEEASDRSSALVREAAIKKLAREEKQLLIKNFQKTNSL